MTESTQSTLNTPAEPDNDTAPAVNSKPRPPGSWGPPLWASAVVFWLMLKAVGYPFTFVPFGAIGGFFVAVPLAALAATYAFAKISKGGYPTLWQGVALILASISWAIVRLAVGLASFVGEATLLNVGAIAVLLATVYLGWGLVCLRCWAQKLG